jgi:hypothetical protein
MSAAATNSQLPVLVFVPGSFAPVHLYAGWVESLSRHGITSQLVDTPSVGKRENLGPQTMSDDVEAIVKVVSQQFEEGRRVVLMTHSYGGIPGTQSLKQLSRVAREADGKSGGIEKIIYLTSVVPPVGVSNLDIFGSNTPDFLSVGVCIYHTYIFVPPSASC